MSLRKTIGLVLVLASTTATVASAGEKCIHFPAFPTLTCAQGFEPKEIKHQCWACVARSSRSTETAVEADEVLTQDELPQESLDLSGSQSQ